MAMPAMLCLVLCSACHRSKESIVFVGEGGPGGGYGAGGRGWMGTVIRHMHFCANPTLELFWQAIGIVAERRYCPRVGWMGEDVR